MSSKWQQIYFDKIFKRLWDVFDYPMPPENAEKILDALEKEELEILGGFLNMEVDNTTGFKINFCHEENTNELRF